LHEIPGGARYHGALQGTDFEPE
ncbi:MAG: hypothetical protein RLZZ55_511, partial [Bacteroidota bacterium]